MRKLTYVMAAVAAVFIAVIARNGVRHLVPMDYANTPVLFVHGHGLSPDDWIPLKRQLLQQGYPAEYLSAVDISPSQMANASAAENFIAPAVEALLEHAAVAAGRAGEPRRFDRVDLVAHSMGAFSSRWYAARLHPERVRIWISIAGANYGTNALCRYRDAGAEEMCPAFATSAADSKVQLELNGIPGGSTDESPFGIGTDPVGVCRVPTDSQRSIYYFTIRIEPDEWIVPARSAMLRGAGGVSIEIPSDFDILETSPGNFRSDRRLDHMSILTDQAVLDLTLMLLNAMPAD